MLRHGSAGSIRYAALGALIGIGIGSYYAAGRLIGAFTLVELREALHR